MALYLPRYNALFVNCPKTGGPFVVDTLERLGVETEPVGYHHSHKDLVGTLRFRRRPYTFAFVRHPLGWYHSYWLMKMRRPKPWYLLERKTLWHPTWKIDPACGDDDFAKFIANVTAREGYLRDVYRLYTGRGTQDEIHFIGKFEHLLDDLRTVLDTIGVPYRADQLHRPDDAPLDDGYTPKLAQLVLTAERRTLLDYGYVAAAPATEPTAATRVGS